MPPTLQDQQFGGLSYSAGYRIDIYKAHKCKNIQSQDRIAQMQQVFSLGHLSMECSRISLTNTFPQLGMFNMFGGWAVPLTNSCRREWGLKFALPWFANGVQPWTTVQERTVVTPNYLDNFQLHVLFCPAHAFIFMSFSCPCLFLHKHTDAPYTFGLFRSKSCTCAPVQIHHGERCQGCGGHHQRQVACAACQGQGFLSFASGCLCPNSRFLQVFEFRWL